MASLGVTTGRTLVASATIQTTIGVYAAGEGVYAIYRGDQFGAAGYFGDAVLRFFAATTSFKNAATATARARAAVAPVKGFSSGSNIAISQHELGRDFGPYWKLRKWLEAHAGNTTIFELHQQRNASMSQTLLGIAREFVDGSIAPDAFVDRFAAGWREERDSGLLLQDDDLLSEKLSTIFCLADLYNPDDDREDYEYDEHKLRAEVENVVQK